MMRKLFWFAVPFGAGCAVCWYILPAGTWLYAAAGIAVPGLAVSVPLRGKPGKIVRIAAIGCALGILWFSAYHFRMLRPAEELAGTRHVFAMELTGYPEESASGARCQVKIAGLRGKAVFYGTQDLLELEPGNQILSQTSAYSAGTIAGEENAYYLSSGVFLRLYGSGDLLSAKRGNAGNWRYLPARLAHRLRTAAGALYSPGTAGLVSAMLAGDRSGLGPQAYTDLSEAGLMHITAVSGLHCGFLIALLGILLFRRQRLTAALGYPVLVFYAVMVGCTPSAVRSCIMAGFMLLAPLAGREDDTPTALAGALLVILLADPFAIASVSLQLSFAAVAGLLLAAGKIYKAFPCPGPGFLPAPVNKIWTFCASSVSASLGVMVTTAPLCAAYFGTLSLASPLANLLVLWMAPVLFACALMITILAGLFPPLAILAVVPEALSHYLLWAAHLLAKLPGHSVSFTRPAFAVWLAGTYALLPVCLLVRRRRWKWPLALALSAACLVFIKAGPRQQVKADRLTAVTVDVGQGAAALFHSGNMTVLVDCGSLNSARTAGQSTAIAMDEYGWDKLDYIVLTHYHDDHANGLPWLLARAEAGQLLLPKLADDEQDALHANVLDLADQYGIAVRYIERPESRAFGGAELAIYPPVTEGGGNEAGLTVLCTANEYDFLVTGDMRDSTEKKLVEKYDLPDIEVLLAGHHGSKYSTSAELLEAVAPELGIISVGPNNFGHPTEEAIARMTDAGMEVRRTDEEGNILIQVP